MSSGQVFGPVARPVKRAPSCSPATQMTTAAMATTISAGRIRPRFQTPTATAAKALSCAEEVRGPGEAAARLGIATAPITVLSVYV